LLGDIPYLGALFRSASRTKTRTNLMVFLRPVVLRDAASIDKLALDRYDLAPLLSASLEPSARARRTVAGRVVPGSARTERDRT